MIIALILITAATASAVVPTFTHVGGHCELDPTATMTNDADIAPVHAAHSG